MEQEKAQKYDDWNEEKKKIATTKKTVLFKEAEVWWCAVGYNVGTESFGKGKMFCRPILIIRKLSHDSCICIPLTSKEKIGSWFSEITVHKHKKTVVLSQIRMLHTNRFLDRIMTLNDEDFIHIKEKLKLLLKLS